MSFYPPPPPGWDSRALLHAMPHADLEQRLADWAHARGYQYDPRPSVEWYQSWAPFVFLFRPARVTREVRASFGDAQVWLVEATEANGAEAR